MDGVAISIIGRPRPLPGHDTPNPTHNTYTLNYEEPSNPVDRLLDDPGTAACAQVERLNRARCIKESTGPSILRPTGCTITS